MQSVAFLLLYNIVQRMIILSQFEQLINILLAVSKNGAATVAHLADLS
jgi:hypothetical protein